MIILHTVNLQNQNKMQAGFKDTPNIAEKMSKKWKILFELLI